MKRGMKRVAFPSESNEREREREREREEWKTAKKKTEGKKTLSRPRPLLPSLLSLPIPLAPSRGLGVHSKSSCLFTRTTKTRTKLAHRPSHLAPKPSRPEVVLLPPRGLLVLRVELRAVCDPVSQPPAVRAPLRAARVRQGLQLVHRVLERSEHGGHALLGLAQQMLQVQQDGLALALVDKGRRDARLAAAARAADRPAVERFRSALSALSAVLAASAVSAVAAPFAIAARLAAVRQQRAAGEATIPSSVALERATNLFVRSLNSAELARLRESKNSYRG